MVTYNKARQSNNFEHLTMARTPNGVVPRALRIYCSTCTGSEIVAVPSGSKSVQQPFADRMFSNKGWIVGKNRKRDVCPECQKREAEQREERRRANVEKDRPVIVVDNTKAVSMEHTRTTTPKPRTMTREDRRIIFVELNEAYIDEAQGYKTGRSDKTIADSLGVPIEWVVELREQNFGPIAVSADDAKLLDEGKRLLAEFDKLIKRIAVAEKEIAVAQEDIASIKGAISNATPSIKRVSERVAIIEAKLK